MRHIRWDSVSGTPVLIAPGRSMRPHDAAEPVRSEMCPFCEGSEVLTPAEVYADRPGGGEPNGPGWLVRAFPNLYPSLPSYIGRHEVVVNSPTHVGSLAELTREQVGRAVAVWMSRLDMIGRDPRTQWPFWFLNQGAAAGASLLHTHAQLIGLPFVPPALARREAAFAAPACPICEQIASTGERLIAQVHDLVVWCPDAPPMPHLVRIAPAAHLPDWDGSVDPKVIGDVLRLVVGCIERALGTRDVNIWLTARRPGADAAVHWHLDVAPRVESLAGLELGAGVITVQETPDSETPRLRDAFQDAFQLAERADAAGPDGRSGDLRTARHSSGSVDHRRTRYRRSAAVRGRRERRAGHAELVLRASAGVLGGGDAADEARDVTP
jgi:UDPglucose--hexose-1-phosphate uridylyltransferase